MGRKQDLRDRAQACCSAQGLRTPRSKTWVGFCGGHFPYGTPVRPNGMGRMAQQGAVKEVKEIGSAVGTL